MREKPFAARDGQGGWSKAEKALVETGAGVLRKIGLGNRGGMWDALQAFTQTK
jgi:hypothetical protein